MTNLTLSGLIRPFTVTLISAALLSACASNAPRQYSTYNKQGRCSKPENAALIQCQAYMKKAIKKKKIDNTEFVEPEDIGESEALATYANVWDRISDKLTFAEHVSRSEVDALEAWYAEHSYYLGNVSKRAGRYIHHIVEELEARDMPVDLALLPFVESAYDPFAYSHGRAAGLWQFIPSTAKYVGIEQNWWYDGRRDVLVATDAALNYLSDLNRRFDGDWMLTLAAYNAGAGTVNRAIRRNRKAGKPTDFWSLDLPKETERYVPKLLALVKIFGAPSSYNLTLPEVPDTQHFVKVDVGSQIDLAKAASLADVTLDELYRLNPGFNRWVTAPEGPHYLLIPEAKADLFSQNIADLAPEDRVRWTRYTVESGDNLITIARKFHVDVASLRTSNNLDSDLLKAGQLLLIPGGSKNTPLQSLNRGTASTKKREYRVKSGDTLSEIASAHKVSTRDLIRWNRLDKGALIKPGQTLAIYTKSGHNPDGHLKKVGYRVRNGDNLSRIASRFNLSVNDIVKWNSLRPGRYLQPGQALTLYVDITTADL